MQKNNASETSEKVIRTAKSVLNEKITNISLLYVTDIPYPMFSIMFVAYNYFVIRYIYDRGLFGCSIMLGEDTLPMELKCDMEWDDKCDYIMYWNEMDKQIRMRIPDKFLKAHGWL